MVEILKIVFFLVLIDEGRRMDSMVVIPQYYTAYGDCIQEGERIKKEVDIKTLCVQVRVNE